MMLLGELVRRLLDDARTAEVRAEAERVVRDMIEDAGTEEDRAKWEDVLRQIRERWSSG